jgi:serine/threonine-protein kinase
MKAREPRRGESRAAWLGGAAAFIALGCSGRGEYESAPLPTATGGSTAESPAVPAPSRETEPPPAKPPVDPGVAFEPPPLDPPRTESGLTLWCGRCHGAPDSGNCAGGVCIAGLNLADLAQSGAVVAGRPDESPLYLSMASGSMPPPGVEPRPSALEIDELEKFILRLEPRPILCNNPTLSWDRTFAALEADLLGEAPADRPFIRYLSLANRYNAGVCDADLDPSRAALSKLINSVSQRETIQLPVLVNDALGSRSLYKIDLRDYALDAGSGSVVVGGVTFADGWEALIANNDYALEFEGTNADNVTLQTETTVPVLFADALIARASVGDLYYGLLRLGATQAALLASLGIDRDAGLAQGSSVLAGTTSSSIASGERLVVRNEPLTQGSYYYESFDLEPNRGAGQGVLGDPLGFSSGDEEGSQALFSLPNGLHGYVAFDAAGNRLDDAPTLFDPEQIESVIRVGVSCMRCHAEGLVGISDQVRDHALANEIDVTQAAEAAGFSYDDVLALYPPNDQLQRILDADSALYRAALTSAGTPQNGTDPISQEVIRFDRDVNEADVAGALLYPVAALHLESSLLPPALGGLDNGFKVDRDDFSLLYASSLCALITDGANRPTAEACSNTPTF